jgi:hypothetical protein
MPTHSWGKLALRYESEAPRRKLLALDGGGIRGLITLEILGRIETLLAEASGLGVNFRLCQFFDYIAGTSTGAIIATGLARGMSVTELMTFYIANGVAMFDREALLMRWKNRYKSTALAQQLKEVFGATTTLLPEDLESLLLIVTRNINTDSPWPVSSNPFAKYNCLDRSDCNLRIPLWQLVRASTAAPVYFPPESLAWDPSKPEKTFTFVDGGMTPYNNPAFLLYRMATAPEYRLGWKSGEDRLLLISVGTGAAPVMMTEDGWLGSVKTSIQEATVPRMMYGISVDQDLACRTLGRCTFGASLDREIGDLIPRESGVTIPLSKNLARQFLYARYNADLSDEALGKLDLGGVAAKVRAMDDTSQMANLRNVGRDAAEQVSLDHFGEFTKD